MLDGNRTIRREPQPGPPRELLRAIDQLAVKARALDEKHDRIVDGVAAQRRRLRDTEDELGQLRHAWLPWQLARKRRLVRHRDSLRARLGNARSEREVTERSIEQTGAALVAHYQAVRALLRPLESLPMSCPECGQESSPDRVARPVTAGGRTGMSALRAHAAPPGRPGGPAGQSRSSGCWFPRIYGRGPTAGFTALRRHGRSRAASRIPD